MDARCTQQSSCHKAHPNEAVPTKKVLREMQTLHAGCGKAEPNNFAPPQTPFPGVQIAEPPKFNQLENIITFTYKPSLVRIDAHDFELSW